MSSDATSPSGDVSDTTVAPDDFTEFRRNVLTVLAGGATTCSDVHTALSERYESGFLRQRIYKALDRLVDQGLVTKEPADDGRANRYIITDVGYQTIADDLGWRKRVLAGDIPGVGDE